jgi:acyl-CoA synthetase (NDP forming)
VTGGVAARNVGGLRALLDPGSVALVGASDRPGSLGALLWHNLQTFRGDVVAVTPRGVIAGHPAVPSLRELRAPVDLAVVATPARTVADVARDAAAGGARALVVLSGGFAETGPDGARLQREVVEASRRGGVRLLGPNSFGVQNCDTLLNASMAGGLPAGGGGVSLITQSGAYGMAIHTTGMEERTRFAKVVSIGNAADVTAAEAVAHLAEDPLTLVCCVFLEGVTDGRAFLEAVQAAAARKPVVVAKTGCSAAGARAARSHTASLAGRADRWAAALEATGAVVARSGLEMLDVARMLVTQPPPRRRRAAVVTNSGGTGVELADLLSAEGVDVPELSRGLRAELEDLLPPHGSAGNPVDITTAWERFAELYPAVITRLARSGEVDVVVPVLVQRAAADVATVTAIRDAVWRLRDEGAAVAVAVCWVAPRPQRPNTDILQAAGIPCYEWPQRTARAVALAGQVRPGDLLAPAPDRHGPCLPDADGPVDAMTVAALLRAHGLITAETVHADTVAAAEVAARQLGLPVVVKTADPGVAHRTEAGGVRTGLADIDAVRRAASELLRASSAGVLVQPMLTGVEMIVGAFRDEQLGPMVMVGLGGVLVEVLDDVVLAPAPLSDAGARGLLDRLRGRAVLTGVRGGAGADLGALAAAIRAAGDLVAAHPQIAELELNPVLATPGGAIAVDWKLVTAGFSPAGTAARGAVRPPGTENRAGVGA